MTQLDPVAQLAQQLVRLRTTADQPDQIDAAFQLCENFFAGLPVVIKRYESNGVPSMVIQTQESTELDIALLGHIDTIPGPDHLFAGEVRDGRLYGRATLDMKAFVATSLFTLRELLEAGVQGNMALLLVADEEQGGRNGTRYLVDDLGYRANVVLVPDDGEAIHRVVQQTKRVMHLRVTAVGKEAHGSRPWAGRNAIHLLMETYQQLATNFPQFASAPNDLWVNTINLGTISGGVATNEVPGQAEMTVDLRVTPETSRDQLRTMIEASLRPGVTYEIIGEAEPINLDLADPVVQLYADCIQAETGVAAEYIRNGGSTDGRYFAAVGSTVMTHQGNGGNCQTDEEYVELASLRQLTEIQKRFISAYLDNSAAR